MGTNINSMNQKGFLTLEAGSYPARCFAVIDLGLQKSSYNGQEQEKDQIMLMFEIPDELIEIDEEIMPRRLWLVYTKSIHEKSNLRRDLIAWRGRDFTEEELNDFDIVNLIGAPCMLSISKKERGGNVYNDIESISKLMKGVEIDNITQNWHFSMDDMNTWPCFVYFPDWLQQRINRSMTLVNAGIQIAKDGTAFEISKYGESEHAATGFR